MSPQKRARQEGAIERTQASILVYKEKLKSCEDDTEKKLLKKKIERAKTTIENTKIRK
jgi:rubrerythrin